MALFTAGLSFSLRAAIIGSIETEILAPLDPMHSGTLAGTLLGTAFLGFALTLGLGSAVLDRFGMGRMLAAAGLCFAGGTAIVVGRVRARGGRGRLHGAARRLPALGPRLGLHGVLDQPAHRRALSRGQDQPPEHPARLVAGGLDRGRPDRCRPARLGSAGACSSRSVIVPALVSVALCMGTRFPRTERAALGVPWREMFAEILRRPMFLVWWGCMFLTAASELAPGQWIDLTLSRTVGMRGIWLLIYVSGMMFVLRHFAGPIAHRISNVGMLVGRLPARVARAARARRGRLARSRGSSPPPSGASASASCGRPCWPTCPSAIRAAASCSSG